MLSFGLFELLSESLAQHERRGRTRGGAEGDAAPSRGAAHLVLGGAAGAAAAVLTTPLDVIKTQLQCGAGLGGVGAALRGGGPASLMAGVGPRVAQTALTYALFFHLYGALKQQLVKQQAGPAAASDAPARAGVQARAGAGGRSVRAGRGGAGQRQRQGWRPRLPVPAVARGAAGGRRASHCRRPAGAGAAAAAASAAAAAGAAARQPHRAARGGPAAGAGVPGGGGRPPRAQGAGRWGVPPGRLQPARALSQGRRAGGCGAARAGAALIQRAPIAFILGRVHAARLRRAMRGPAYLCR